MNIKYHINLEKVEYISITPEREYWAYRWVESKPPRIKRFLGIPICKTKGTPEGWYDPSYGYLKDPYPWMKLDKESNKIFIKASVEITFGYKDSISFSFDSNSEAYSWVDDLVKDSEIKFKIINYEPFQ
jgi:hypothetical protein